jgi:electron transfer flavoprotein-quinone oxidoreductase
MSEAFDVAIVGAGPAGISAACILAQRGVKTIVLERGEYAGAKNMFGGVLYGHDLAGILPDFKERNCPIERNIVESRIWYLWEEGGYNVSYRDRAFAEERQLNAFTVGRARFDRWYADQAKQLGALVVGATVVTDLLKDAAGRVVGVRTDRPEGDLTTRVVLLADGVNSPLAVRAGIRPEPRPVDVALAVKELIELPEGVIDQRFNVGIDQGVTTEVLGSTTWGMNGVAFLYTNRQSISLGIGANLADLARERVRLYEMLESFKAHPMVAPLIEGGKSREYLAHWLPEGGYDTIPQLYGDGYLIAGDSAMLFNALHREGSNLAMTSGRLAAETILQALERADFTRKGLQGYGERLRNAYVLDDMRKYRRFPTFLEQHRELFDRLPEVSGLAAREMLTVDGVSKKIKQQKIWRTIRSKISLLELMRLAWEGWRSVK